MTTSQTLKTLERVYRTCHRADWIHPDPLECVYRYSASADREIVGLIAAALAYGRVAQILRSVSAVLDPMGASPREFLLTHSDAAIRKTFDGFRHRWTSGAELAGFLIGIRRMLRQHRYLEAGFLRYHRPDADHTLAGLAGFVNEIAGKAARNSLLPDPEKGSACKRLHLYLRWMVRSDAIDPGCWSGVRPDQLIVPLDTHLHRMGLALSLTQRKQADLKTALEITNSFKNIAPEDPLRYDFALTRLGIRADLDPADFIPARRAPKRIGGKRISAPLVP